MKQKACWKVKLIKLPHPQKHDFQKHLLINETSIKLHTLLQHRKFSFRRNSLVGNKWEKKVSLKQVQFQVLTWQLSEEQEATHGYVMELPLHKTWPWMHIYGNKWNLFQISWANSYNIITTCLSQYAKLRELSLMDLTLNTKQLIPYFYLMLFQLRRQASNASVTALRYVSKILWNFTNISFSLTTSSPIMLSRKIFFNTELYTFPSHNTCCLQSPSYNLLPDYGLGIYNRLNTSIKNLYFKQK